MCNSCGSCVVSPSKTQKKRVKKNHTSAYFLLEHKYIHFLKKMNFLQVFFGKSLNLYHMSGSFSNEHQRCTLLKASLSSSRDGVGSRASVLKHTESDGFDSPLLFGNCALLQFISEIASTSSPTPSFTSTPRDLISLSFGVKVFI